MKTDPNCIFCKIVAGRIPSKRVHEDDELIVFHDIQPAAPVHLLVVPREHFATLDEAEARHQALLGRMVQMSSRLAREAGAANGYRVVINNGPDGGQEVAHLHMHVLGGPRPWSRLG